MFNKDKEADEQTNPLELPEAEAPVEDSPVSTEGLVEMSKDGFHLHVHPTTVADHMAAGWKIV